MIWDYYIIIITIIAAQSLFTLLLTDGFTKIILNRGLELSISYHPCIDLLSTHTHPYSYFLRRLPAKDFPTNSFKLAALLQTQRNIFFLSTPSILISSHLAHSIDTRLNSPEPFGPQFPLAYCLLLIHPLPHLPTFRLFHSVQLEQDLRIFLLTDHSAL